jgi:hypothetical protein
MTPISEPQRGTQVAWDSINSKIPLASGHCGVLLGTQDTYEDSQEKEEEEKTRQ